MQMKPENLPLLFERGSSSLRGMEWGGMVALLYSIPAGTDMKPLMAGMPDDLCQCPHWGYVIKGRLRITHKDSEQVVSSGELFYAEPGHVPYFEEDTQMIEFSPKDAWYTMIAQLSKNMAAIP